MTTFTNELFLVPSFLFKLSIEPGRPSGIPLLPALGPDQCFVSLVFLRQRVMCTAPSSVQASETGFRFL